MRMYLVAFYPADWIEEHVDSRVESTGGIVGRLGNFPDLQLSISSSLMRLGRQVPLPRATSTLYTVSRDTAIRCFVDLLTRLPTATRIPSGIYRGRERLYETVSRKSSLGAAFYFVPKGQIIPRSHRRAGREPSRAPRKIHRQAVPGRSHRWARDRDRTASHPARRRRSSPWYPWWW